MPLAEKILHNNNIKNNKPNKLKSELAIYN